MRPAALLLLLTACSAPASQAPVAPHQVKILSVACDPNHGRPRADISIQNVGQTSIEWPKAVVSFGGVMSSVHVDPRPLHPGAIGTIYTYAPKGSGTADCSLAQVHDGNGVQSIISR